MSSDSEQSEQEAPVGVFKGLYFFLHGPNPGLTRNGLAKLIKQGGGKVLEDVYSKKLTHVILSGNYWAKRKTANADLVLKRIEAANEENATDTDENCNRVWLLPVEWVKECLEKGKKLKELNHDFERTEGKLQAKLEAERKAELAEERRANNGNSKYKRGERKRSQTKQLMAQLSKEQDRLEKEPAASEGAGGDAFSGVVNSSPALPIPGAFPNSLLSLPAYKPRPAQSKLTFSIADSSKSAAVPKLSKSLKPKGITPRPHQTKFGSSTPPATTTSSIVAASSSPARPAKTLKIKPSLTKTKSTGGMFGSKAASRPPPKPAPRLSSSSSTSLNGADKGKGKDVALVVDSDSDSDTPLANKLKKLGKGKATKRKVSLNYTSSSSSSDDGGEGSDVPLAKKRKATQAKANPLTPVVAHGYSSDSSIIFEDVVKTSSSSGSAGASTNGKGKKRARSPSSSDEFYRDGGEEKDDAQSDASSIISEPAYVGKKKKVIAAASEDEEEDQLDE